MGKICPRCNRLIRKGERHCCPALKRSSCARTAEQEADRNAAEPWRVGYRSPEYRANRERAILNTGGRCSVCGKQVFERIEGKWRKVSSSFGGVHHVVPLSRGGTNELENLVVLCRECHARAHSG